MERRAPSILIVGSIACPPGVVHPEEGRTARLFAVARMGRGSCVRPRRSPRGSLARRARRTRRSPCVETKNNPQRADADGEKRARARRQARETPPTGRSRTCTRLPACLLSHALDARPDALPRRLSLRARRAARCVARAFSPARGDQSRPPRFARERAVRRDVPCVPTMQPELVPSESPVSSLRGRCPARRAWRSRRRVASEVHLSQAREGRSREYR